jgi:hypothetical protein
LFALLLGNSSGDETKHSVILWSYQPAALSGILLSIKTMKKHIWLLPLLIILGAMFVAVEIKGSSSGRRKLDDFIRQFGLGQPDLDHVTDYLADQVWNRHARLIGRPSKTAHPFLVERIDWKSS